MKNILHKYSKTTIPRGYRNKSGMKQYIMLRKLRWKKMQPIQSIMVMNSLLWSSWNWNESPMANIENSVDNVIYNQYDLMRKRALKQMKLWL